MYRFPNVFKRVTLSCFYLRVGSVRGGPGSSNSLQLPLDNLKGLEAKKVAPQVVEYLGRKAVRVQYQPQDYSAQFVTIAGLDFQDGVIEVDLAGTGLLINSEAPGFWASRFAYSGSLTL
jgi:hypothetical protein